MRISNGSTNLTSLSRAPFDCPAYSNNVGHTPHHCPVRHLWPEDHIRHPPLPRWWESQSRTETWDTLVKHIVVWLITEFNFTLFPTGYSTEHTELHSLQMQPNGSEFKVWNWVCNFCIQLRFLVNFDNENDQNWTYCVIICLKLWYILFCDLLFVIKYKTWSLFIYLKIDYTLFQESKWISFGLVS